MTTSAIDTEAITFMLGTLGGFLFVTVLILCITKDEGKLEISDDTSDSDETSDSGNTSDSDEEFHDFIIRRMRESEAFQIKIIRGVSKLHKVYPNIYAKVMRK